MVLSFLLILAALITGLDVCNIQVCLTWTVQKNYLDIRCRVNSLRFGVEVVNNRKKEQGFCVHPRPIPKCFTSYNNTLIMQNSLTNITYLRIQGEIDSHVNGEWECKHGTNRDSATINVTVLDSGSKKIQDQRCWQSYLSYTMIGFSCPIFSCLCIIVICRVKCVERKRTSLKLWFKRKLTSERYNIERTWKSLWQKNKLNSERCKRGTKYIRIFIISIILALFLLPVIKGAVDYNICKDEELYIIVGVTIAFLFPIPIVYEIIKTEKDTSTSMPTQESPAVQLIEGDSGDTSYQDTQEQVTSLFSVQT